MPALRVRLTPAAIIEPIAAARADGFSPELLVVDEPDPGWTSLRALSLPAGQAERHRRIERAAGPGTPPRLPVAWEIEAIAWLVGAMVGGSLIQGNGLATPHPGLAWARIGPDGLAAGLAIASRTRCVAARVTVARDVITGLLAPLVDGTQSGSARVRWWHAGDRVADALLWLGDALGTPTVARRAATELLAPGVPYSVPLGVDGHQPGRTRRTCCLARRTASGETCDGCPHRRKR